MLSKDFVRTIFHFVPCCKCEPFKFTQVGQLYGDGSLYEGVHLVEQFIPGRVFTFNINGKFPTVQNDTLTYANTDICTLPPHLAALQSFSTMSANPSILLDSTMSLLKNVFQMISCLTNPFLSGFLLILFILSLLWSFVLALWTFHVLLPSVCSALDWRFCSPAAD